MSQSHTHTKLQKPNTPWTGCWLKNPKRKSEDEQVENVQVASGRGAASHVLQQQPSSVTEGLPKGSRAGQQREGVFSKTYQTLTNPVIHVKAEVLTGG